MAWTVPRGYRHSGITQKCTSPGVSAVERTTASWAENRPLWVSRCELVSEIPCHNPYPNGYTTAFLQLSHRKEENSDGHNVKILKPDTMSSYRLHQCQQWSGCFPQHFYIFNRWCSHLQGRSSAFLWFYGLLLISYSCFLKTPGTTSLCIW